MAIKVRKGTITDVGSYIARQLNVFSPATSEEKDRAVIQTGVDSALKRMEPMLESIRNFTPGEFNPFNALQHSTYLYLLANELWNQGVEEPICERLFCLNRAHHCIDLFYKVKMPEVFFLSHGIGAVLGDVQYDDYLVIFQNVTVGRVGEKRPTIGKNVVLYPGSIVSGDSRVGDNCVISAGTVVHNQRIPDGSLVKMSEGQLVVKSLDRVYADMYFRR